MLEGSLASSEADGGPLKSSYLSEPKEAVPSSAAVDAHAAAERRRKGPVNMDLLVRLMNSFEEAGLIEVMDDLVERHVARIEAMADPTALRTLDSLRAQIVAAKEREAVGGRGSLYDPNHRINVAYEERLAANPGAWARPLRARPQR